MPFSLASAIWAAEITLRRRVDGASTTLYVASGAGFTVSAAPAVNTFRMVLTQPVDVGRTMFDDHKTTGSGRASVGTVRLSSPEGQLDDWRQYIWDGGTFALKRLATGDEYTTDAVDVLEMTIERAIFRQTEIEVQLRDWQRALEVPLQTDLYLGDNVDPDGIEGGAELKDKPKPIAYGHCRGINPVCVNTPKAIFAVNDGPIDSVVVRDRGIGLFPSLAFAARTSFTSTTLHAVAAGNSLVVAGGAVDVSGTPNAAFGKSADGGVTWTDLRAALAFGAQEVTQILWAFGNKWIITGSGGGIKTTPDLVTFTARTSGFGAISIDTMCEGDGVVVIMGAGDRVSTTTDGVTWSFAGTGLSGSPNWRKCVKFRGQFVALTDDGRVAVSSAEDGVSWQWVAPDPFLGLGTNRPYQFLASDTLITTGAYGTATSPAGLSTSDSATAWVHEAFPGTPGFTSGSGAARSNAMTFGAGIYMHVGANTVAADAQVGISTDGRQWTYQTLGMGNISPYGVCFDDVNESFVAVGVGGAISSSEADEYANTTDLEDDDLEPPAGFYKVCPSTGHFRLGFLEDASVIRADVVQGATSADRTAAQLAVQILEDRAGFTSSDYSTSDVTDLDAANSGVVYFYTDRGDEVNCAQALDELIRTPGGSMFTDASGVVRMARLEDPAPNLVTLPSSLASAPWAVAGGSPVATNAIGVFAGKSFSRITAADTGPIRQLVTLADDGEYYLTFYVRTNGVNGTNGVLLYDNDASASRINVTYTIASGVVTVTTVTTGTHVRTALLQPASDGVYGITVKGTGVVAANDNYVYGSNGGGTLTSVQLSEFLLVAGAPAASIDQADMDGMEEADSSDPGAPAPPYQTKLKYRRNYAPMGGSDFAGDVDDADRAELSKEWHDVATTPDTAIQTAHPFAEARIEESNFAEQSDAQDEADRRQALHGVQRYWFDVPVFMTDATLALELNDIVEFTSTRFGMGAGQRARVMGIAPDAANGRMRLSGWL